MDDMNEIVASEIIEKLNAQDRARLARLPGFPVKTGTLVTHIPHGMRLKLRALKVIGPNDGLTVRGAVVAERLKCESEPF